MSIRAILLAGLIAVVPMTDALAQSRDRDRDRGGDRRELPRGYPSGRDRDDDRGGRDQRGPSRQDSRQGERVNPGDVARRVQQNRPGRMLGVRETGGDYVVRWEYPGGRVSDIPVDGRSGQVRGD